ncbi:retrotransposon protein, putative, ty1-copia subclass [Tanacetum coccineum]
MDGIVHTYKARLVAKGYTQTYGVDYEEMFSPVADIRAIRILIAIAAFYDYEIWKMDIKIAFLNGYLNEDIYMVQAKGFVDPNHPKKVSKFQRSIYGLKQASRSWNKRFDEEIKKFGFAQNLDEPCVYQKASGSNVTFFILYVDDIIIMGNHIPSLQNVKSYIGKYFAMKDLGKVAFILGIKIYQDRSKRLIRLNISQERLDLNKTQGASTPEEVKHMQNVPYALVVGSIMYVTAVKTILKYLRNTKDIFLVYDGNPEAELRVDCYCDVGFEIDRDDIKSQTRYVFVLNGGAMDWKSSKQTFGVAIRSFASYMRSLIKIDGAHVKGPWNNFSCCGNGCKQYHWLRVFRKAWYWKTCKAYLVSDFEKSITDIREVRLEAYRKIEDVGFEKWSRAYCLANRYNYMTSDCAESINSLTKIVRKVPIMMLMNYYRDLLQRWYFECRYDGEDEPPLDELSQWAAVKVYHAVMFVPCLGVDLVKRGFLNELLKIMPPRMRTRSAGRPVAESRGGETGGRVGRGGGRGRGLREVGVSRNVEGVNGGVGGAPNFSMIIVHQLQNLLPAMLAQVGNQRNVGNQNGNLVNENVQENVGNVIVNGNRIEKMEYVQDMSGCSIDQKVKYTAGSFVVKALTWAGHAAYTDRFHELSRLVPHLVTLKSRMIKRYVYGLDLRFHGMVAAIEPNTIQKVVQISGALTDEAVRNGSIKKVKKRGNVGEPSKDKNGRDDNKKTRTGNTFATTANPVGRENTAKDCRGVLRNVNPVNARNPTVRACYECGNIDHVRSACPRLNRAQRQEGNRPNQVTANNGGQGRGNQRNQARGRVFMLGAEEARPDPNIMTGIEPSELGFRYEIEIVICTDIAKITGKRSKLDKHGHENGKSAQETGV